jgi:hypothetical protein
VIVAVLLVSNQLLEVDLEIVRVLVAITRDICQPLGGGEPVLLRQESKAACLLCTIMGVVQPRRHSFRR